MTTPADHGPELLPPFPARDDADGWAAWWHEWARLGRVAGGLDPDGALYEPVYTGDDKLPDLARRAGRDPT